MPIDLTVVVLRWLQFAAAVVALGLPLFQIYAPGPVPARSARWAAIAAGLLLAVGAAGGLVAQTAMMAGGWAAAFDPASIGYVIQSTALGMAHMARAALALAGVAILMFGQDRRVPGLMAVMAFAGATASFAWSGHGAASEGAGGLIHLIADIIHALAAAVWLGALAGFCIRLCRPFGGEIETTTRDLAGFATVGSAAVSVLVLTGLINAGFLIGIDGVVRVASSTWGLLLLGKLALFILMVGLAAHNRFTLTPALARAITHDTATDGPVRRLQLSIGLEMAAGLVLLGLVAAMGVQMPPASM
ncbi:MAG: copper homeostasis membrane protein CopD [Brevundimonas sp.]|uniref:copper homeostasis membrane protein CopD n=1 Tax=Brevundimonas sp. TaxID=1871086 RepID=UPI002AB98D05|nr:copper homeostasis membrane protein CopD [Brevundimonas sp.]MDZ4110407.1 copper homeostasis membrane protein CopD [Brevundimonas sp.]